MPIRHISRVALVLAVATFTHPTRAAESFDGCTGTIPSLPATLSTQGVWCLTSDLATSITTGNAILVAANNVTIDCNGFKIGGLGAGPGSMARGIRSDRSNTRVRNCHLRGFFAGVEVEGDSSLVTDSIIEAPWVSGVRLIGEGHEIRDTKFVDIGGTPYAASAMSVEGSGYFHDNFVDGVSSTNSFVWGFSGVGSTLVVTDNVFRGLQAPPGYTTHGIVVFMSRAFVERNRVESLATLSESVVCQSALTVVRDNSFLGFPAAFTGCNDNGGNVFAATPAPP